MGRENEECEHRNGWNFGGLEGGFFRNPGEAQTCGTGDVRPGFWPDKGRIAENQGRKNINIIHPKPKFLLQQDRDLRVLPLSHHKRRFSSFDSFQNLHGLR